MAHGTLDFHFPWAQSLLSTQFLKFRFEFQHHPGFETENVPAGILAELDFVIAYEFSIQISDAAVS